LTKKIKSKFNLSYSVLRCGVDFFVVTKVFKEGVEDENNNVELLEGGTISLFKVVFVFVCSINILLSETP
jgi:hypothetical protein